MNPKTNDPHDTWEIDPPFGDPDEEVDWGAFRREASMRFLQASIVREGPDYCRAQRNVSGQVSEAIMYADELIQQLKG